MVEFLSVHVPKTAGTAFWRVLMQVYEADEIYRDVGAKPCQPGDSRLSQIKLLHTHYPLTKYLEHFPDSKKIVWVRHPIFRVISDYFFAKSFNDRNNPLHVEVVDQSLSLLEYAQKTRARNVITKYTAGLSISDFFFVGVQEFYNADLLELKKLLGWSGFKPVVKNSNPSADYYKKLAEIVSDTKLMRQLANLNRKDMALYEAALMLRAQRRKEPLLLQCTLAEWSRLDYMAQQISPVGANDAFANLPTQSEEGHYDMEPLQSSDLLSTVH